MAFAKLCKGVAPQQLGAVPHQVGGNRKRS